MHKLVWKDLLVLKRSMCWALLYLLTIIMVFSMTPPFDNFIYIMAGYGATYILIMGALMAEFKNQADMFLNSLPVTRYEIVLSKYLSALALTLMTLGAAAVLGIVMNLLPLPLTIPIMTGKDAGIVLLMAALTLAIVMPMNLWFGNQAARVTMVLFFMLLFFAPVWIKNFIVDNCQTDWAQALIGMMASQPGILMVVGDGLVLLLLALSVFVSLRVYAVQDF